MTGKLLHHGDMEERFGAHRYFVSCDSATSLEGLVSLIARHVGLTEEQERANGTAGPSEVHVLTHLRKIGARSDQALNGKSASNHPIIVVLDNFESCWEPEHARASVENFLSSLATVENLTLIITLRGIERPSNVAWTRPFFPPLKTIDRTAAREMFLKISDARQYNPAYNADAPDELDELLLLCGHLPLAIRLTAELTAVDNGEVTEVLKRWKGMACSPSLLDNGDGPSHSLEVSIRLSLDSPRMKRAPGATTLLSILSLLPDGIREDALDRIAPELPKRNECRYALLKTALAYTESGRLKVLAPIRSYVASNEKYRLKPQTIRSLQNYFWGVLGNPGPDQRDLDSIKRVLPELGNIERLIDQALENGSDPSTAITAATSLGQMFLRTSLGKPRLAQLQTALKLSEEIGNNKLKADCIYTVALATYVHFNTRGDAVDRGADFLKALELYQRADDKAGEGKCLHQLGSFYYSVRKFEQARDSCKMALQAHIEAGCLSGQVSAILLHRSISTHH